MISYKIPEEQWHENLITTLPVEDDRFEFKEDIVKLQDIAKEICALANSFGGTLFLGVKNKTHEIVGVPKNFPIGSRSDSIEWLERQIPQLLLFRFNSFRIRPVKLSSKTQNLIGKDKIVISIDVFDSDSAPYQVAIKGNYERRYYYRENSNAELAPHSHLAYLWLRNSADKTRVVQYLITNFLTPLIEFVEIVNKEFTELRFHHINYNYDSGDYIKLSFFSWEGWKNKVDTLAAEQFLRQEDSVKLELSIKKLSTVIKEFEFFIKTFSDTIFNQVNIDIQVLSNSLKQAHPKDLDKFSEIAARILTYVIFDLRSNWNIPNAENSLSEYFRRNEMKNINENPYFVTKKEEMMKLRNTILEQSNQLLDQAKILRYELCIRYNTIYSDIQKNNISLSQSFSNLLE